MNDLSDTAYEHERAALTRLEDKIGRHRRAK
jgi:hypothetical protein